MHYTLRMCDHIFTFPSVARAACVHILVLDVLQKCVHNEFLSCIINYYDNEI